MRRTKGLKRRPAKFTGTSLVKQGKAYLRVPSTESEEKFNEIGELVQKKKLKWSHYSVENLIGIHYYLILKKQV